MTIRPILYAEDEEDDVFFLKSAFAQAGIAHPLRVVADGQLAINYLSGLPPYTDRVQHPLPCLVLLDIKMPNQSGIEVLKWMRANPAFSSIPVIMLSSSNGDADIHRAYIQGANGYLVKPGKREELLSMVKAIRDYWLLQNRAIREGIIEITGASS